MTKTTVMTDDGGWGSGDGDGGGDSNIDSDDGGGGVGGEKTPCIVPPSLLARRKMQIMDNSRMIGSVVNVILTNLILAHLHIRVIAAAGAIIVLLCCCCIRRVRGRRRCSTQSRGM